MRGISTAKSIVAQSIPDLILNEIDACVFVCDSDKLQILYANNKAQEIAGKIVNLYDLQWISEKPVDINLLKVPDNPDKQIKSIKLLDFALNPSDRKWYKIQDKLIYWFDEKMVRLILLLPVDIDIKEIKQQQYIEKELELFSLIAINFSKNNSFASKINEVIKLIGQFLDVSRISIFEKLKSKHYPVLTYEWCNSGIKPKLNYFSELKINLLQPENLDNPYPGLIAHDDLSGEDIPVFSELYHQYQVQAIILLPFYVNQKQTGYLSIEECLDRRKWSRDEIELVKTIGNILCTSFERKGLEEERIRVEQRLKKANAAKEKFFSLITNDLQAPFSALTSLSNMLLQNYAKWPDEKRLLFVESIRESSSQGYMLLENLITWSKIQSGTIDFYPKDVDLRSAVNLAVEQLSEKARNKNIRIYGLADEFTFVYADYMMLHSVIKNLLSNAIKFTEENGEVRIEIKKNNDFAEVSVFDNGVGIEKAFMKTLFKLDRLSSDFGPTEEKGTGLGLIICREFVEKNGGRIWAESKYGLGSCFKFTVPLCKY